MMVPLRSLLVFVVAVSFPTAAQAQQCTGQPSCQSCLDASTDCTWSAGACLGASSRCINPEFCYNAANFPALQSNADICAVADTVAAEAVLCQQRTSCGDCVATPLSGGGTCQWFNTPIGVSAGICANQCNPVGQCGVTTCGTVADDGAAAVVQSCSQAATCNDCLSLDNLNCGWASFGECFDNGCNDLADVACFSTELFVGLSPSEICQVEQAAAADRATCSAQSGTDCTTCVGTTLADGTTACQWFDDTQACASACGQLGCGVTECPARVEDPAPSPFDCSNQNSCLDCLTDDNDSSAVSTCGWVVGSCYESCDVIADVECYSASTIPSSTASQICDLEAAQRADAEACSSVTTCADCLATSLTAPPSDADSPTTCQWLVDLNLCASACGQLGCGVTDQCPDGSGLQSACSQATSCNDCLETTTGDGSSSCAWTIGQCMDSCRVADAPCYTTSGGFAGQTPDAVCQAEQTDLANAATCRSQSSCSDCIATTLADGTTKCRWFEQGNFCGHECGLLGCGVSDQCPADPVPEPPSITGGDGTGCSAATSCTDCLETTEADGSSASCAWTIGQCMDSCRLADAPCYTTASDGGFAGQTPEEVCLVEQTDNANAELCLGKSSCSDCIATTLADGTTKCQWFEQRNVCGHACTLLGCGVSDQCPTDLDDVPEEPPTIVTDGDGSGCSQATSCTECLAATSPSVATQQLDDTAAANNNIKCAWSAGACADSCAADATCYSADAFPNLATGDAICQKEQTDLANAATCNNQSTCTDCVGTKLDDGTTTCQWFGNYCASACGMEGCGVTQCAEDATPPASSSSCSDATTCIDCMSSSCAWTVGECMDSCMVADASCYTTSGSFAGQTPQQICQVELDNQANAATCDSQGSCSDCVTTVLTDGTTTCQWFADGNYCGSGCGMQGCGATTCEDDDSSAVAAGGNSDFLARFSWLVLLPMVVGSVFGCY